MAQRRVISRAEIDAARRSGRVSFEILPGDIVTDEAREAAQRLQIRLLDGPLERPVAPVTDSGTTARRMLFKRGARWIPPREMILPRARRLGKLVLIGAGGVGANIGHLAANQDIADDIVFIDIAPGVAEAAALDLNHASGVSRTRARATGGTSLALVENADVVVVTAGRARSPGMTRADLIDVNARVMRAAGAAISEGAPGAVVIVVTNPLDEMTYEMLRATGFPRERVLGMAGTLDTARFRNALAMAAGVELRDVDALTLGAHGEEMVPVVSASHIKGRPLHDFLSPEQISAAVKDTITGGGQVVALRKTGSATVAPAHSTIEVIDHLRGARAGTVPVSVLIDGELGLGDVVLGVPCRLGATGLLSIEMPRLTPQEHQALLAAAEAIRIRLDSL
ncbi:MAG: malate dehydrogenase [Sedimentitalea sp.]